MPDRMTESITALQILDRSELLIRWEQAFRGPAPKKISRGLLLRVLAYHLQEQAEGGLSKAALKRLAGLAAPGVNGRQPPKASTPRLKVGTRLIREWRGEVYQVTVTEDGFEYRCDGYKSLSQIARTITGTRWSGPLFFGLRKAAFRPDGSGDER